MDLPILSVLMILNSLLCCASLYVCCRFVAYERIDMSHSLWGIACIAASIFPLASNYPQAHSHIIVISNAMYVLGHYLFVFGIMRIYIKKPRFQSVLLLLLLMSVLVTFLSLNMKDTAWLSILNRNVLIFMSFSMLYYLLLQSPSFTQCKLNVLFEILMAIYMAHSAFRVFSCLFYSENNSFIRDKALYEYEFKVLAAFLFISSFYMMLYSYQRAKDSYNKYL